ncbi:putative aliphatic sulfonates-binding protein precursor [Actinomadura rubteroloni]|uniref:Putative aliphatic sulfonates-binding protein n=1 Tax=Actinomadura rubteroloni TaxID=1926885 RepID=A0A2P4UDD1_9ACTN|nr:ABC transporter substrate-binding protein [Actinomadura rubteroloni]POM23070.1 putative aliphatic sulfonates-binding protein precursor [Actinomadura rubteroloni]
MPFPRPVRAVLGGALAALLALGATGCGDGDGARPAAGPEKAELTVGTMPIAEGAAVQIAIDRGYFRAEGLTVHQKIVAGGAQALPQLKDGGLDIAHCGHVRAIAAQAGGGYDLRIIAEASQMTPNMAGVLVARDSPVTSLADLAGKKIGTNARGDEASLLLRAALQPYGVRVDEKDIVVAPFPDQEHLLKTGEVDAIVVTEPFVSEIQEHLGARLISDFSSGPTKDFPMTGYVTTRQFARRYPRTVAAFQRAFVRAQAVAEDRAILQEALPRFTKLDPQIISAMNLPAYPTSVSATRLQRVADIMREFGYIRQKVDVTAMAAPIGP